jgi:hypothetical protein
MKKIISVFLIVVAFGMSIIIMVAFIAGCATVSKELPIASVETAAPAETRISPSVTILSNQLAEPQAKNYIKVENVVFDLDQLNTVVVVIKYDSGLRGLSYGVEDGYMGISTHRKNK